MTRGGPLVQWLRSLHRGYKFAVLLVAAWAPLAFPTHPPRAWVLMIVMTVLFLVATGPSANIASPPAEVPREQVDAQS